MASPVRERARAAGRAVIAALAGLTLLVATAAPAAGERITPRTCTYETYTWNVHARRAVDRRWVTHAYAELRAAEVDPATGCSVCREDQTRVELAPLAPFHICHKLAPRVREVLGRLLDDGLPIYEVGGYRVGKTRGDADGNGNRTLFSNHSFGIAMDLNPGDNGLYDRCLRFGPHCRLIRGGPWRPGESPASLTADGAIVRALKGVGLHWGGEIAGKQKDFMHFSVSGY